MELSYKYDKCNFFAKFLAESKYFSSPAKLPIEMSSRWNLMRT